MERRIDIINKKKMRKKRIEEHEKLSKRISIILNGYKHGYITIPMTTKHFNSPIARSKPFIAGPVLIMKKSDDDSSIKQWKYGNHRSSESTSNLVNKQSWRTKNTDGPYTSPNYYGTVFFHINIAICKDCELCDIHTTMV